MTIERRLKITACVLVLSVLGTAVTLFLTSRVVADGIKQSQAMSKIVQSAFMLRTLLDEFLVRGDKRPLQQWNKEIERIDQILDSPGMLGSADAALLEDLKSKYRKTTSVAEQAMQLRASEDTAEQRQNLEARRKVIFGLLYRRLEELAKASDDANIALLNATLYKRSVVQTIIVATGVLLGIIILVNIFLIRKSVVYPLEALSAGVERIGAGNFDYVAETKSDDEVGKLSRAFNTMVERLREYTTALSKAKDELELRVEERTAELTTTNDLLKKEIEERKRAEEDLVRSNEDLQQFAYVASHDLQEPLRNVASCLQMLEKDYKNKLDATADQYIHYAVEGAVRMKALILDLLAYSRVATKGKPPGPTDCEQIFDQTLNNLRAAISETGAVITHDPLPSVFGDDTQLLQVLQNLIGNAIKFRRDEQPQIHVSAARNRNDWTFSIKDNGIGIESRHLDRIFVIFQRLHKRSQYDGTGMGLAIVKKIVERHGGRVWTESELGVGTTFYFAIPEKRAEI